MPDAAVVLTLLWIINPQRNIPLPHDRCASAANAVVLRAANGTNSHTFTYVNRVVEGHGASFNWRLCNYEMPDKHPAPCHHKV